MVFFPSYRYMEAVEKLLDERYERKLSLADTDEPHDGEGAGRNFWSCLKKKREQSFVGLCVLGGIFSEGIDLKAGAPG